MALVFKNQAALVTQVGEALYGHLWKAIMAKDLKQGDIKWMHRAIADPPASTLSVEQAKILRKGLAKKATEVAKAIEKLDAAITAAS